MHDMNKPNAPGEGSELPALVPHELLKAVVDADMLSLEHSPEEEIAPIRFHLEVAMKWLSKKAALSSPQQEWISVDQELPPLDADNCCMDEEDYGRYSEAVIVFDEDEAVITSAVYDGRKDEWSDARNGGQMFGITHWRNVAPPVTAEGKDRG